MTILTMPSPSLSFLLLHICRKVDRLAHLNKCVSDLHEILHAFTQCEGFMPEARVILDDLVEGLQQHRAPPSFDTFSDDSSSQWQVLSSFLDAEVSHLSSCVSSLREQLPLKETSLHHHCTIRIGPIFIGCRVKLSCFVLNHHCTITASHL